MYDLGRIEVDVKRVFGDVPINYREGGHSLSFTVDLLQIDQFMLSELASSPYIGPLTIVPSGNREGQLWLTILVGPKKDWREAPSEGGL